MLVDQHGSAHAPTVGPQSAETPSLAPTPKTSLNASERISAVAANGISCPGCQARWTGTGRAHCAAPGCHRTFSTARLFDLHRSARGERGTCLDPTTVRSKTGEPLLVFRDGMWRGPELTDDARRQAGWSA